MKKTLFYFLIPLLGFAGQAQTILEYTYDISGNQTFRKQKTSSSDESIILKPIEPDIKTETSLSSEEINNKFRVSPNPTSNFAELSWNQDISESITKIELVSLVNSERTHIVFSRSNTVRVDLSQKSAGFYIVIFHLNNERVSIVQKKIIKL